MEEKIFISSNGFEYLEQHLTEIYGERGSFKHNLIRFVKSDFFYKGCHFANSIDDLPEITFEEIKKLIERENNFRSLSNDLFKKYDELSKKGQITDSDHREIAGIMGLAPGQTDRIDTLFPNVLDLYVSSKEEGEKLWNSLCSNKNLVNLMVNLMMDSIRPNQTIKYKDLHLLSLGYARNYFRGENAFYKTSKSSLFRGLDTMNKDKSEEELVIRTIKMFDFSIWLSGLKLTSHWYHGDVFNIGIAQHYGIKTNGIDVSSNLKIALFFACCYYDDVAQKWFPLPDEKFEHENSREEVEKLNGDSRYGVLYAVPADIAEMSRIANIDYLHFTDITPVGIQPFQRCERQSAFLIWAPRQYDMLKDKSFAKVKFRLTREICDWIYNEMKQGELIYPNESIGALQDVIDKIKNTKTFTLRAYDKAIKWLKKDEEKAVKIKERLTENNYNFCENIEWCSKEDEQEIKEYCFQTANNIKSTLRPKLELSPDTPIDDSGDVPVIYIK